MATFCPSNSGIIVSGGLDNIPTIHTLDSRKNTWTSREAQPSHSGYVSSIKVSCTDYRLGERERDRNREREREREIEIEIKRDRGRKRYIEITLWICFSSLYLFPIL